MVINLLACDTVLVELVNLRNRTGEERRRTTLRDKRDVILLEQTFRQTSPFFLKTGMFVIRPENLMLRVMITTKHASNSPVMFVTHESFAVLFSLPSCCVNSLLLALCSEQLYYAIQDLFPGLSSASPILSHGHISEEL